MSAPDMVWIAVRDGRRLGVFASEPGAKACAEAKYREMRAFYGRPTGRVEWRSRERQGRPEQQALYATRPEFERGPEHFSRMDEVVIRCEVQP